MPYSATVSATQDSYYTFVTTVATGTITVSNLTVDVDVDVYTSSNFTAQDQNWSCTSNAGTTSDECTVAQPVAAGASLYIKAHAFASVGGTFTLNVVAAPVAQGSPGAPLAVGTVPFNGFVTSTADSYYSFVTTAASPVVILSNLTADVDPLVYSSAAFASTDANWSCSASGGTTTDSCTATTPVAAGTTLYIKVRKFGSTAATYTLHVPVSQGAAGAPLAITTVPFNGTVGSTSSFYSFAAPAGSRVITLSNLVSDADPSVYTTSAFTTTDATWSCTNNGGTTNDTCTRSPALAAAATVFIRVTMFAGGGTSHTLNVAP